MSDHKDSWITCNIRPLAFVFMLSITTLLTLMDGNISSFTIKEAWVDLWTSLTIAFATVYASARTFEKVSKIKK